MSEDYDISQWRIPKNTQTMTRSFEFDSYDSTRQFLDDLADLSEETGYYPNLNFNRTQVNISIQSDNDELGDIEYNFAVEADKLYTQQLSQEVQP